jgi:hypothetical protein
VNSVRSRDFAGGGVLFATVLESKNNICWARQSAREAGYWKDLQQHLDESLACFQSSITHESPILAD